MKTGWSRCPCLVWRFSPSGGEQAREGRPQRRVRRLKALELVTFQSADHQGALVAIREKRPPSFHGR
jgi:hypothetical protein